MANDYKQNTVWHLLIFVQCKIELKSFLKTQDRKSYGKLS